MQQKWNAKFAKPLLNQVLALMQRDQAAALAIVNVDRTALGEAGLKPITQWHKGRAGRTGFPWLTVWMKSSGFDLNVDLTRSQMVEGFVAIEAGTLDQEHAQEDAWDYVRMADIVLTSAPDTDWKAALSVTLQNKVITTVPNASAPYLIGVSGHTVDAVAAPEYNVPVVRGTVTMQFHLEET